MRKWRIWLVEILAVMITIWLWLNPPDGLGFWVGFIVLLYFGSVVVMDIEHKVILHEVSAVGVIIGFGVGVWQHGILETLLGGIAGFGIMFFLFYLGDLFGKKIAQRRDQEFDEVALGFGDVNLAGVIGLLLGWPGILAAIFIGVMAGGVMSMVLLLIMLFARKYKPFTAIPYGPALVTGAVALLFFKDIFLP